MSPRLIYLTSSLLNHATLIDWLTKSDTDDSNAFRKGSEVFNLMRGQEKDAQWTQALRVIIL